MVSQRTLYSAIGCALLLCSPTLPIVQDFRSSRKRWNLLWLSICFLNNMNYTVKSFLLLVYFLVNIRYVFMLKFFIHGILCVVGVFLKENIFFKKWLSQPAAWNFDSKRWWLAFQVRAELLILLLYHVSKHFENR